MEVKKTVISSPLWSNTNIWCRKRVPNGPIHICNFIRWSLKTSASKHTSLCTKLYMAINCRVPAVWMPKIFDSQISFCMYFLWFCFTFFWLWPKKDAERCGTIRALALFGPQYGARASQTNDHTETQTVSVRLVSWPWLASVCQLFLFYDSHNYCNIR